MGWGYMETLGAFDPMCGEPIGAASLVNDDMAWRQSDHGLRPWLSSVYVQQSARRQGVGLSLVEGIVAEAGGRGFPDLYLYADDGKARLVARYERWGFESVGRHGGLRVMRRIVPRPLLNKK